jgi:hypothetical protein
MSVTDGSLTTDGAQQSVRVVGTITTTPGSGTQTVAGTVTANQGTANTAANGWPVKLTDGTNNLSINATGQASVLAAQPTAANLNVTSVQGTAAAVAQAWPIKNTDGTNTANIAVPGPNLGAGLVVSTGVLISTTSLNAATATGPGTVADFGSAKSNITLVVVGNAGITAGTVALEVSQDNANWYQHTTTAAFTAAGVKQLTLSSSAFRYARANITVGATGGTISASLMAS